MFRAQKARPAPAVEPSDAEPTNESDIDASRLRAADSDAYSDWEAGNRPDAEDMRSEVLRMRLRPSDIFRAL